MHLYRLVIGHDEPTFDHRVSEALNKGWSLYGSPTLTVDPETKRVVCGQAIVKEIRGKDYSPEMKLSEQ